MIQCKSNQQNMDRGKMLQGKCPGFSTDNYKERKEKRQRQGQREMHRETEKVRENRHNQ